MVGVMVAWDPYLLQVSLTCCGVKWNGGVIFPLEHKKGESTIQQGFLLRHGRVLDGVGGFRPQVPSHREVVAVLFTRCSVGDQRKHLVSVLNNFLERHIIICEVVSCGNTSLIFSLASPFSRRLERLF